MQRNRRPALSCAIAIALAPQGAAAQARPAQSGSAAPLPLPALLRDIPVHLLVDVGSGQVLSARQPDLRFVPASMTKVMTLHVAFEELRAGRLAPRREFVVPASVAREWSGRGTSMRLAAGERAPLDALLHGLATASANDAAVVLATGHSGSVRAWSRLMNASARELGMSRSHFASPSGWPDGGRTHVTARDLATLGQALVTRHPGLYRHYFGRRAWVWKGRTLASHDPVSGVVPGADGIKTGFTREAGYNFLGSAEREGRRLLLVVAGARGEAERAGASRALLEWGFSAWRARPLFAAGRTVAEARVQDGAARSVRLVSGRALYAAIPRGARRGIELRLRYKGPLVAPIRKGAHVANLEIRVDGMAPGLAPLYAGGGVARAGPVERLVNALARLFE